MASAIVAMAVLAMLQSITASALSARGIADRRLALLVAQSQLAAAGYLTPLDGQSTGSDGIYQWRVTATPQDGGLVRVDVVVGNGKPQALVSLSTLKFAKDTGP
ncbi:MAG TPA: type II secretion system protein [Rhizomicrobium sp.]